MPDDPEIERLVAALLERLGEDPGREGLERTPSRVARSLRFLTSGSRARLEDIVNGAVYHDEADDMVIVKDIEFFSLCEHHLLPFFGKCHVGYVPKGRVIGVSKIARVADFYARRLQMQERLTRQIADTLMEVLAPLGVAVVMEAQHMCITMRGVEKQHSKMVTSAMLGCFRSEPATRAEFMALVRG